jgi:hypothetical protein
MATQHPRDFSPSQWFYIVTPSVVAPVVAWFGRKEMEFPMWLYFALAGLALSLFLCFLMVYGEDL